MMFRISGGTRLGFLLSMLGGMVAGCGVIYTPQEFEESALTYGYKGDFDVAVDVVPLTFMSARAANSDGYVPKALPGAFSDTGAAPGSSARSVLTEAGVYDVTPPLLLDMPPPVPAPYQSNSEIVPPVMRSEDLQPLAYPEPLYLPLPVPSYDGTLQPQAGASLAPVSALIPMAPYVPGPGGAMSYTIDGQIPVVPQVHGASSVSGPAGRWPSRTRVFSADVDLDILLERPQLRQRSTDRPLPYIEPRPYRIGVGDVIGLQFSLAFSGAASQSSVNLTAQQFLVQDNGEIFVPQVGSVSVGGLTLMETRRIINDRLVASGLGFDPSVQITAFNSKKIYANGLGGAKLIQISVRPVTLSEAVVSVGGFGARPENAIVRVLRNGDIYEMSGDRILGSSDLSNRILIDGDFLSITSSYDPESAIAYFDQQLRLREVERSNELDALAQSQEHRADAAEIRATQSALLDNTRFDLELRKSRLEADRLRREAEIARLQSQRETDRFNEAARIANIEARQTYLDRLRTLEELNRGALDKTRQEARQTLIANQAERARARADRLEILELEFQQEQVRLDQMTSTRQELRTLFGERMRLGAIQQDYITVAGETKIQTTIPLPFEGRLTLNRVLYEETNGIDPLTGDTSEIYVIRTPPQDRIQDKVIAYHLNASNPAALSVASIFEMRPNDVVYVNPQSITKWNRVLTQILPSTGLVQSSISAASGI